MTSAGTAGGPATTPPAVELTTEQRQAALEKIAEEVRACTKCRLADTRTRAVPGEGRADTEVVFVGEGPGQTEDQQGRPFVGRAGDLLVKWLSTLGWRRQEVFITNIVKCRPPGNRDPEPDEIAACVPYLQRQLEILDPAVVATLGRFSMGHFRPGERITQIHGTTASVAPGTGAPEAVSFALFHPAAALRSTEVERQSFDDIAALPSVLRAARDRRSLTRTAPIASAPASGAAASLDAAPAEVDLSALPAGSDGQPFDDAPTLF